MKKCFKHIAVMVMLTVLFFSSFPITALADEEITVTELSATGEITSDVNVRKGPGTDYEKIGTVRAGDTVTVTGQSHDGWYRIEFQGTEGFVYGQYMTIVTTAAGPENTETVEGQQETLVETEEATHLGTGLFKTAAIVVIIGVIIVMIILTLKSMRHDDAEGDDEEEDDDSEEYDDDEEDDESEEYEDDEEDDDSDDYDDEEDDDSEEYDDEEDGDSEEYNDDEREDDSVVKKKKPKPIVIIEEDYQLHIDPKYFEDEPIAQPDCVTGYLQKKQQEEEEQKAKENQENSGDLQQAMDKLKELQEEIEKLKKKRE